MIGKIIKITMVFVFVLPVFVNAGEISIKALNSDNGWLEHIRTGKDTSIKPLMKNKGAEAKKKPSVGTSKPRVSPAQKRAVGLGG